MEAGKKPSVEVIKGHQSKVLELEDEADVLMVGGEVGLVVLLVSGAQTVTHLAQTLPLSFNSWGLIRPEIKCILHNLLHGFVIT